MATDIRSRYQSRSSTAFITRRPPHTVPSSTSCPSFALLSILGTIAASCSNVNASPAPPAFLCPSFDPNHSSFAVIDTGAEGVLSLPTKRTAGVPRSLPDQYTPGSDGMWRKVERYTLYGSTVCPTCSGVPTPVDDDIEDDGDDDVGDTTENSVSASPSPSYDITNSLPPGWKQSSPSTSRTTLILVLSLVLAFMICFVIISLVFWRKTKRRKHRHGDVEIEASKAHPVIADEEDRESMAQKESKTKQKIWARATARWKANVRYTARQRRGKRMTSTNRMSLHTTSADLVQTQSGISSPIPSTSGPLSSRSSIESMYSDSTVDVVTDFDRVSGNPDNHTQSSLASSPASLRSPSHTSPPAYHQRVTSPHSSGLIMDVSDDPIPSSSSSPSGDSAEPIYAGPDVTLHPPILAAHVATDDKALLARLAESASSPPLSDESAAVSQSSAPQVSAPVWRDEEFEDFPCDPGGSTSIHVSSLPVQLQVFPPPPCKGKMAALAFHDYPYSFEDLTLEVEGGPSAPPFDDLPGAPPTNGVDITPSAPPLMDTGYYAELSPSAVQDWRPDDLPPLGVEQQDSLDQAISSDSQRQADVGCNIDTINARVEQGPVASVGTLPRYHP